MYLLGFFVVVDTNLTMFEYGTVGLKFFGKNLV